MKITKVKINNFGCIGEYEYTPTEKIASLIAPNGAGKSTFCRAIVWCLTGEAPNTKNIVKDGKEMASVSITIDDGVGEVVFGRRVKQGKNADCLLDGKKVTGKVFSARLKDATGNEPSEIALTTQQEIAESMEPSVLMSFLLKKIPDKMTCKDILDLVDGLTTDHIEQAEDLIALLGHAMTDEVETQSFIKELYAKLHEKRASVNSELDFTKKQIVPYHEEAPARPLEAIRADMVELSKLSDSKKKQTEELAQYSTALMQFNKAKSVYDGLLAEFNAMTADKPALGEEERLESELSRINEETAHFQKLISNIKTMIGRYETQNASFKKEIERIEKKLDNLAKPYCLECPSLKCTTDKSAIKDQLLSEKKEIESAIAENDEYREGCTEEESRYKSSLDALAKEVETTQMALRNYRKAKSLYQEKIALGKRVELAKSAIPDEPVKPVFPEVEGDVSDEKERLEKELSYAETYAKNQEKGKQTEALSFVASILNDLCKAFAPKGSVLSKVQDAYLKFFNDALNERARVYTGRTIEGHFEADEGVRFFVSLDGGPSREYHDLSRGEQFLAVMLLLDLFNSLYATGILVLDDANHLDAEAMKKLLAFLQDATVQSTYDHIFVCAAANSDAEAAITGVVCDRVTL